MKVFVTGVNGQLGYDVFRELSRRGLDTIGSGSAPRYTGARDSLLDDMRYVQLDITDQGSVDRVISQSGADAVIHCAAYTKVDMAEDEPDKCWQTNVDGTRNIALACRENHLKLMYISTDYVFPGTGEKFYEPGDPTGPAGVYGLTKLGGELAVRTLLDKWFIVRISWAFGIHGSNFVKTMLRLAESRDALQVVCDQIGSPTYTADLAPLLCDMIQSEKYGVYHATNEGVCSWAEFAREIFRLGEKNVTVQPIPTNEYPSKAKRPLNSRMSKDELENAGFQRLAHWKDALARYMNELEK